MAVLWAILLLYKGMAVLTGFSKARTIVFTGAACLVAVGLYQVPGLFLRSG
jgi:hypothetical protein